MQIKHERPPNYDAIRQKFGRVVDGIGVMFTYGDTIYYPRSHGEGISKSLVAHEIVHSRRQGDDPAKWWEWYLNNKEFRFEEELVAHQVEYVAACEGVGRQQRRQYLAAISKRLAGPLYGNMTTKAKAKLIITGPLGGPDVATEL